MQPVVNWLWCRDRASRLRRWLCPHESAAGHNHLQMQIVGRFVVSLLELLIKRVEKSEVIASPLKNFGEPPFIQKRQIPAFHLRGPDANTASRLSDHQAAEAFRAKSPPEQVDPARQRGAGIAVSSR